MSADQFEHERLAWFRRHGFTGGSAWYDAPAGRRTYALDSGGDGIPTILVHGGLGEASVWGQVAGGLEGRIIVPDRPGCGLSDPVDYTGADFRSEAAAWLEALVDALGSARVRLVGNSMGGFFAMAFATAQPQRVERLVLVGAPAGLDRPLPLFLRLWGAPALGGIISKLRISDPEKLRKQVFSGLVADPSAVATELLRLAIDASSLPGTATTTRTMLRTVTTLRGWRPELMMRDAMATLAVPTTFVWGADDAFAPPSSGHELADRMPDADVIQLERTGHMPQIEQPELVVRVLTEVLARPPLGDDGSG